MQIDKKMIIYYFKYNIKTFEDFSNDISMFKKLDKMLEKIYQDKTVSLPMIINIIIILSNLFGIKNVIHYLKLNTKEKHIQILKTLLIYNNLVYDKKFFPLITIDDKLLTRLKSHD